MSRAQETIFFSYLLVLFFSKCDANTTSKTTIKTTTFSDLVFHDLEILCKLQPNSFDCDGSGYRTPYYYYDVKMEDCKSAFFGNHCPYNTNMFKSLKDCHNSCRVSGRVMIDYKVPNKVFCRMQPDFGYCNSYQPMWYYDMSTKRCRGFSYSGCGGNQNRFVTSRQCNKVCWEVFH
ncbi:kunitz-type serine protease inhibitor A-like [Battus philenor]|uniref:kunitz-type serine protease inhibitor A-like n=1 Tax=Battus philenor TaxID=42288 RepID=UPI0035D0C71F